MTLKLPLYPPLAAALAAAGGILEALAFPEIGLYPLVFLCLIPLWFAVLGQSPGKAFFYGWIYGIALSLSSFSWLAGVMSGYGGLGPTGGAIVLIILAALMALYQGIFAYLINKVWSLFPPERVFTLSILGALFWTGLDYLKNYVFTGFNWTPISGALAIKPQLLGLSDALGVYGLGLLVAFINLSLALAIYKLFSLKDTRRALYLCVSAILVFFLILGYGLYGYRKYEKLTLDAPKRHMSVLQASIDQEYKWDATFRDFVLNRYSNLALEASKKDPFLIIWPETSAPFLWETDIVESAWLKNLVIRARVPMLVGLTAGSNESGVFRLHNRALLFYPDGAPGPYYDKSHLVPFGEYIPMLKYLPILKSAFLQGVLGAAGNFSPGKEGGTIILDDIIFGPLICFESTFPYLARKQIKNGASVLLVTTNDAWFGESHAPTQHFYIAVSRAIESRRPLVRAANNGRSGLISPSGRIISISDLNDVNFYDYQVPILPDKEITIHAQVGYLLSPFAAIFTTAALLFLFFKKSGPSPALFPPAPKGAGGKGGKKDGGKGGEKDDGKDSPKGGQKPDSPAKSRGKGGKKKKGKKK
jgi:apolipoprotein N-acyltransferase